MALMPEFFRFDRMRGEPSRRWAIGLCVSSRLDQLTAVVLGAEGRGLSLRAELVGSLGVAMAPDRTGPAADPPGADNIGAQALAAWRCALADNQAALATELLAAVGLSASRVVAIGLHDPGLWHFGPDSSRHYLALSDAACLAEQTGLNVIDAFPGRDLAGGGLGGPILALAEWQLLSESNRTRLLLDLGRTCRLTYLPKALRAAALPEVVAFDVGPGTALIDALTERLTGGDQRCDVGGRLAAQGRRIAQLVEHWLSDPFFQRPPPRWHPRGVRPERFLADALRMALVEGWSVRDLLCSATHLIAESVARAIDRWLPAEPIDEILVTGGGRHNGMLLGEIARRTRAALRRVDDSGIPAESLEAAAAAVLALFHLDQVPGNALRATGADVPRMLGRLTPGSPQNWQRLVESLSGATPPVRSLRAAI